MNYYKAQQQTDAWLRTNGLDTRTFSTTNPRILKAQQAATLLLNQNRNLLDSDLKRLLENFQRCYANTKKRDKITDGECYRVLNIQTKINRVLFKQHRQLAD